jgi:hypothetical protein|tara:strand:+ start:319 stop:699 length:381 start_codon:yes stop_codon:yes gene_type:complete
MKTISVKIKQINVSNFSTRDENVELEILFNNYKTIKSLVIDDPNELAHDLIVEIRRKVKQANQRPDSDNVLDNILTVTIENEEETIKKISTFLSKLSDKINEVKNLTDSGNYLNSISLVKSMKLEF